MSNASSKVSLMLKIKVNIADTVKVFGEEVFVEVRIEGVINIGVFGVEEVFVEDVFVKEAFAAVFGVEVTFVEVVFVSVLGVKEEFVKDCLSLTQIESGKMFELELEVFEMVLLALNSRLEFVTVKPVLKKKNNN